MDPTAVLKSLWRYRWYVLPAVLLTMAVALWVYFLGPRTYESIGNYALASPDVPSDVQMQRNPALMNLNDKNPFLHSSDQNLVSNVVMTRLKAPETTEQLASEGLSTDYEIASGAGGNGSIVQIMGIGPSANEAVATARALGKMYEDEVHAVQTVDGADERYLFTTIAVSEPTHAQEQFSSRLRSVIIVCLGGLILVFGAVSLGRTIDGARARHRARARSSER